MTIKANLTTKQTFDAIEDQQACGIAPVKALLYKLVSGEADAVADANLWQLMADRLDATETAINRAMDVCEKAPDKMLERQAKATKAEPPLTWDERRLRLRSGLSVVGRNLADARATVELLRSEAHTSDLQSLMRISYDVSC